MARAGIDYSIRRASASDLALVVALLKDASLPVEGLSDAFHSGFAVAERAGALVGAAGIERYENFGLLRSVVVSPEYRGSGIGIALVDAQVQWARAEGLSALYLLTETAEAFFSSRGFQLVERADVPEPVRASKEFAYACPASAATLVLGLSQR